MLSIYANPWAHLTGRGKLLLPTFSKRFGQAMRLLFGEIPMMFDRGHAGILDYVLPAYFLHVLIEHMQNKSLWYLPIATPLFMLMSPLFIFKGLLTVAILAVSSPIISLVHLIMNKSYRNEKQAVLQLKVFKSHGSEKDAEQSPITLEEAYQKESSMKQGQFGNVSSYKTFFTSSLIKTSVVTGDVIRKNKEDLYLRIHEYNKQSFYCKVDAENAPAIKRAYNLNIFNIADSMQSTPVQNQKTFKEIVFK